MAADRFVDTNVLLALTAPGHALHAQAHRVIDPPRRAAGQLAVSGQVLREYLVVATRPIEVNGLGLAVADALHNVGALLRRLHVVGEDERVLSRLHELLREVRCSGKQIHDANLVATMLTAGMTVLITANPGHFARYVPRIEVIALADL